MPALSQVPDDPLGTPPRAGMSVTIGEIAIPGDYSSACTESATRRDLGKRTMRSFLEAMPIERTEGAAPVPVHRFPNELLVTLFEWLVESQEFERRDRLFKQESTGGDWQLSAILSVSGVCRRWREVAHSVKALWRFI